MPDGVIRFLVVCAVAVLNITILMYAFSLNKEVKQIIKQKFICIFHTN